MRLTTLRLTSFRSYYDVTMPTEAPRVLIAGVNGSGKSSLREAVRWLLTGHCGVTDGRGAGAELLAPHGSSLILVEADSPTLGTLRRRRNNGITEFTVGDVKGEPSLQQQALYIKLNTTPEFVDAVLETEHFLRLHHAEAKALVLSLLNVRVSIEHEQCIVGGYCSVHKTDQHHRKSDGATGPFSESLTLEQLDARYKAAFDERKAAKVKARTLTVPAAPEQTFPAVADVEAQLAKLRQELAVHQQDVGLLLGQRAALQAQLTEMERLVPEPADASTDIAAKKAACDAVLAEIEAIPDPIETGGMPLEQQVVLLKHRQQALQAFDPKRGCVVDTTLDCPLPKRKVTMVLREIAIQLEAIPPSMVASAGTDPFAAHKAKLEGLHHDIRVLEDRQQRHLSAVAENNRRRAEAERLRKELATIGEADPQKVEAMGALKARIAKGDLVLKHAIAFENASSTRQTALEKKIAAEADVERLEALCELLGPNGVRVQALSEAIGRFTTAINASLAGFGWELSFGLEPWTVAINGRPVQTYSESEQFRIGIGIQLAVAQLSGLSFAIVDRLDMLDVKNRALVTKMILASHVEQVFILATREAEQALPTGAGVIAHRLGRQGGQTAILESVGV